MQVLTETALRAMHLNSGDTVTVERDSFVTESARRYALERGIRIAGQEEPAHDGWQRMTRTPVDRSKEFPFVDDRTGEGYREKPEGMTHLYGNRLVPKTDPRILFRGRIDSLQAEILLLQYECDKYGEQDTLLKLGEILDLTRKILGAEVKREPMPEFRLFNMTAEELKRASHDVKKSMGMEHPVPDYRMGALAVRLNRLRTQVREAELSAAQAFPDGSREDIVLALNRMSSAVYLLFLEGVKKHERR
ncbi:MAG: hypothetical protein II914_05115 [Clostridia bacterium]|nr:hypothetical protein [Clostridia bacterium]